MSCKLVKVVCARCGKYWYVSSVREYVLQVEMMWRFWEKSMTPEQKEMVKQRNNPARLEEIVKAEGQLKSTCDQCRLELTLKALYDQARSV